jgi:hypothetical protein
MHRACAEEIESLATEPIVETNPQDIAVKARAGLGGD